MSIDPGAFPLGSLESRAAARALLDQRARSEYRCEMAWVYPPESEMATLEIRLENVPEKPGNRRRN
jgi:hypothetical protein